MKGCPAGMARADAKKLTNVNAASRLGASVPVWRYDLPT